jgi:hypothetical protein
MIASCFPIISKTDPYPHQKPDPVYAARSATNTAYLSMKLGFICPNLPGHLNPMTALARHLQYRGHEVVFLYSAGAAGLPFVPGLEEDQIEENRPEMSKLQGEHALQFTVRVLLSKTEAILKSLPEIVRANEIDALVIDTVQFYAELGPMQLGMPYARKLQKAITKANGLSVAADLVEESLSGTKKAGKEQLKEELRAV